MHKALLELFRLSTAQLGLKFKLNGTFLLAVSIVWRLRPFWLLDRFALNDQPIV